MPKIRNHHRRFLKRRGNNLLLVERPFEGDLKAKLYVGVGAPENILYWIPRAFNPAKPPLVLGLTRDASVETVAHPDNEFSYTLSAELEGEDVWYQIWTCQDDYANQTLFRPRHLETDGDGDGEDSIYGTATVVNLEKRDGGGLRITFVWRPVRDGIQPETFNVVKTSGAGTIADVEVSVFGGGEYTADVVGLTNEVDYTFRIDGVNGSVTAVLVTGIAFTGDAEGPPAVTNVVASEA